MNCTAFIYSAAQLPYPEPGDLAKGIHILHRDLYDSPTYSKGLWLRYHSVRSVLNQLALQAFEAVQQQISVSDTHFL